MSISQLKPQLVAKAWQIDLSKIEEGFVYSEMVVYSDNRNIAKKELLKNYGWDMCLRGSTDELTYLTIPIIRCKQCDKYSFEDKTLTSFQIEEIKKERERTLGLNSILHNDQIVYCHIKKNGSYYRPNHCGYTEQITKAGVYQKKEAIDHAKSVREITVLPISIAEHNLMIQEAIDDLKTRLL